MIRIVTRLSATLIPSRLGILVVACALSVAAGIGSVQAQNAAVVCPAPRTIFTFTDSSGVEAMGGSAPICRFKNTNGGQQFDLFLGAFSTASPIVHTNVDKLMSLLPLQVGKAVQLSRPASTWQATVSIEKYETVAVPVGRLACFVVLWTEPSGQGKWERRWWYCPALGFVAKYSAKFEVVGGGGSSPPSYPASWELMQVRVP
jgi:hypothetical protein